MSEESNLTPSPALPPSCSAWLTSRSNAVRRAESTTAVNSETSPCRIDFSPPVSPLTMPTLRTIRPQDSPSVFSTVYPGSSNVVDVRRPVVVSFAIDFSLLQIARHRTDFHTVRTLRPVAQVSALHRDVATSGSRTWRAPYVCHLL